jgi:hypothetical protein
VRCLCANSSARASSLLRCNRASRSVWRRFVAPYLSLSGQWRRRVTLAQLFGTKCRFNGAHVVADATIRYACRSRACIAYCTVLHRCHACLGICSCSLYAYRRCVPFELAERVYRQQREGAGSGVRDLDPKTAYDLATVFATQLLRYTDALLRSGAGAVTLWLDGHASELKLTTPLRKDER